MDVKPRRVVYIAGPYSSSPVRNTKAACDAFDRLFDAGLSPIVPHLSMLLDFNRPRTWEEWLELDLPIVARCEAVLRLPGESKGADMEVEHAQSLGIPVFHAEWDLIAWSGGQE